MNMEDNIPHISPQMDDSLDHSSGNITVSWNEKRFVLADEIVSCGFHVHLYIATDNNIYMQDVYKHMNLKKEVGFAIKHGNQLKPFTDKK